MIIQPMPAFESESAAALTGMAALPQLGVIRAQGEQAAAFLQGQLTQDVEAMPVGQARLAAYCNAKGRMLASFVVCRHASDEFWLVCSRDLLTPTLKKLSMFVLRAKVRLADASDALRVHGAIGAAATGLAAPDGPLASVAQLPPADGAPRALWIGPADNGAPAGPALPSALWDWASVRSGVATLTAPVVEVFVPQMLNYESVDGVNFKKGCYPGQEVVARSQFRGAIKRRAYVGWVDGAAQAGQDVFAADEPGQPCGLIAQAAPAPSGGTAVIAVLKQAAAEARDTLAVDAADGPRLTGLSLPYPLIEI